MLRYERCFDLCGCCRFLQLKVKRLEEECERNFKPKDEEEMDQLNEP